MFHQSMYLLRRRLWILFGAAILAYAGCVSRGDTTVNAGFTMAGTEATGDTNAGGEASGFSGSSKGGTQPTSGGNAPTSGTDTGGTDSVPGSNACDSEGTCSERCLDCDDTPGCETSVTAAAQCGSCTRACSECEPDQGACTGKSVAIVPVAIQPSVEFFESIAVGGSWLYLQHLESAYRYNLDTAGAPKPITLTGVTGRWRGIATDATTAYIATPAGVYKVSHSGTMTVVSPTFTFADAPPLATFSPLLVGAVLYFVTGTGANDIETLGVARVDTSKAAATIEVVPSLSLPKRMHMNDLDTSRLPSVAADANGNTYLCAGMAGGLRAAGDPGEQITDDHCAGAAVVGANLYFRSYDPAQNASSEPEDLNVTQLYKRALATGSTPTALGDPNHTVVAGPMRVKDDAAIYYSGFDAPDTVPGAAGIAWVVMKRSLSPSASVRLAANGFNAGPTLYDCLDIAVDSRKSKVYFITNFGKQILAVDDD